MIRSTSRAAIRLGVVVAMLVGGSAMAATPVQTLLSDDFNDGVLDPAKWVLAPPATNRFSTPLGGYSVTEANGVMRIGQDQTDRGGHVQTARLAINDTGVITISRRVLAHYANNFYLGQTYLYAVDSAGTPIQLLANLGFGQYDYGAFHRHGFGNDADGFLVSPVWDAWFDDLIVYDPVAGTCVYTRFAADGQPTESMNLYSAPLDSAVTAVYLDLHSYGWYTGHYIQYDQIDITQTGAAAPEPAALALLGLMGFVALGRRPVNRSTTSARRG